MEAAIPAELQVENAAKDTETAWIEACQRGDAAAFNRLVLKWEKPVYNLALRMLQDCEEAAEVAQEVFLSAFQNIRKFRKDARFCTWLYRIAANRCLSRLRRRPPGLFGLAPDGYSVQHSLPTTSLQKTPEADLLHQERRSVLLRALRLLTPEQRLVIELKFFQELTFEEIADVVEAPLSTVKSRLYAGLEMLKTRLAGTF